MSVCEELCGVGPGALLTRSVRLTAAASPSSRRGIASTRDPLRDEPAERPLGGTDLADEFVAPVDQRDDVAEVAAPKEISMTA